MRHLALLLVTSLTSLAIPQECNQPPSSCPVGCLPQQYGLAATCCAGQTGTCCVWVCYAASCHRVNPQNPGRCPGVGRVYGSLQTFPGNTHDCQPGKPEGCVPRT